MDHNIPFLLHNNLTGRMHYSFMVHSRLFFNDHTDGQYMGFSNQEYSFRYPIYIVDSIKFNSLTQIAVLQPYDAIHMPIHHVLPILVGKTPQIWTGRNHFYDEIWRRYIHIEMTMSHIRKYLYEQAR